MISTALPNPPRWLPVRIVLGGMTKVGTGCFDVMLPLSN
jgi:hypothetical protein